MSAEKETPNFETFDLIEALSGISYPEDEAEVYFDSNLMYLLHKADQQLAREEAKPNNKDNTKKLQTEIDKLKEAAAPSRMVFKVRAIPQDVTKAIQDEAFENFPEERGMIGNILTDRNRDEFYTNKLWAAHILEVRNPDGKVFSGVSEEAAKVLRGKMPQAAVDKVQATIDGLYEGAKAGYEQYIQDVNFLSDASQEAEPSTT